MRRENPVKIVDANHLGSVAADSIDTLPVRESLARYLCRIAQAGRLTIDRLERLSGGAIQENWALSVALDGGPHAGRHEWVLRTDAPSAVSASLSRAQEYAVLRSAHGAGVKVPAPLWLCDDPAVIGRAFFVMERLKGTATGYRLTRGAELVPDGAALAHELGANLARLHAILPPQAALDFLPACTGNPARRAIAEYHAFLGTLEESFPVLEWGLRWCELKAPECRQVVLLHRDYRTGNYMVEQGRLSGVLDWEFTGWGDPREDLGWFTARCWRFNQPEREAGGIGEVQDFLDGYASVAGGTFSRDELRYWQVMAHLRWAVIALQQAQRHLSGQERSLELALTGRMVAELELEILELTKGRHG